MNIMGFLYSKRSNLVKAMETLADEKAKRKKLAEDPDKYKEEFGRCPKGYSWDPEKETCVKTKEKEPEKKPEEKPVEPKPEIPEKPPAEPKPEVPEKPKKPKAPLKKPKYDDDDDDEDFFQRPRFLEDDEDEEPDEPETPEKKMHRELNKLAKQDYEAYQKKTDELRAQGVLPDEKTADLLVRLAGAKKRAEWIKQHGGNLSDEDKEFVKRYQDLPKDPKKMAKLAKQYEAQKSHEDRVFEGTKQYLEKFEQDKELAERQGRDPPRIDPNKMIAWIEKNYGRPVANKKQKDRIQRIAKDKKLLEVVQPGVRSKPGSWQSRLNRWFWDMVQPTREKVFASVQEKPMDKVIAILDEVSDKLEALGQVSLVQEIDAVANDIVNSKPTNREIEKPKK